MNNVEQPKSEIMHIDLHGLHVHEAESILQDYVLPVLPVLKRVYLITGRGKHSKDGKSVLKESVMTFLREDVKLALRCEEQIGNDGVLFVAWTM